MNLIDVVNADHASKAAEAIPHFKAGDTISVHAKITEGAKTRIQIFQGMVISIKKRGRTNGHFRVRKVSGGIGVERVFPFHSPNVDKVEVIQKGKTRRAKLFYLRDRSGKSARIAIDYDRK
ncbi:MAG: 50S ribosomal protein L19 [Epsilonproteobacteria bacterium]|nr:MAG: 50S ribosomal protein L19 [Campylobacterota bacterium]RLA65133.1 MAG: 50S ribosomal protein L19 [Campylobacterota bacterium]